MTSAVQACAVCSIIKRKKNLTTSYFNCDHNSKVSNQASGFKQGQRQTLKVILLTSSVQLAPFWQGCDEHSLIHVEQIASIKPGGQWHVKLFTPAIQLHKTTSLRVHASCHLCLQCWYNKESYIMQAPIQYHIADSKLISLPNQLSHNW